MANNSFRWTIIGLFVALIVAFGFLDFLIWNQQVDHELAGVDKTSSQSKTGSDFPRRSGGEPSAAEEQEQANAQPVSSEEKSEKKPNPKHVEETPKKPKSEPADGAKIYQVDTAASRIYVKVGSATRLGHPHGVEGNLKSGKIELGAEGELIFDMSSFKADTKEARQKVGLEGKNLSENEAMKVGKTMLGADVLNVEKFPTATYKIITIKPAERQDAGAPGAYEVNGRFFLHGAEKPVKFQAKLERIDKQGSFKLSGSFAIKQTDFGIRPFSAVGGLVKVADQLEIHGELFLSQAK